MEAVEDDAQWMFFQYPSRNMGDLREERCSSEKLCGDNVIVTKHNKTMFCGGKNKLVCPYPFQSMCVDRVQYGNKKNNNSNNNNNNNNNNNDNNSNNSVALKQIRNLCNGKRSCQVGPVLYRPLFSSDLFLGSDFAPKRTQI